MYAWNDTYVHRLYLINYLKYLEIRKLSLCFSGRSKKYMAVMCSHQEWQDRLQPEVCQKLGVPASALQRAEEDDDFGTILDCTDR